MPNIAILGSTGSIGTQTLQVLDRLPNYKVFGLSARSKVTLLSEQVEKYQAKVAVVDLASDVNTLMASSNASVYYGEAGLCELASHPDVDIVVVALVGSAGLKPTLAALEAGKRVALANKETLVIAGHHVMKYRNQIIPIDSEHNAIWQCLDGKNRDDVASIILTASGGPFYNSQNDLSKVTVAQALKHPNWDMGGKITIDSASMMNKGLEVIEAHWLFGMDYDSIEVIIHPQSLIHSMVRFIDGSILAQLATTDMRLPIQYALTYPATLPSQVSPVNLWELPNLTFQKPDLVRFPCLSLAYHGGKIGGTMPTVLNGANEIAVSMFLSDQIRFTDIPRIIENTMANHQPILHPTINEILAYDQTSRIEALEFATILKGRMKNI